VVDGREFTEESIESNRISGVEGCGTQGINLTGSVLEALGIPAREDHLGPFCTRTTCRFESDASATADHNKRLPKELWFTVDGGEIDMVLIVPPIRLVYFSLRCQQFESRSIFSSRPHARRMGTFCRLAGHGK
jgi:hypothetical protein